MEVLIVFGLVLYLEIYDWYYTLKNVMKTCDLDPPRNTKARNVVMPPFIMAGPIITKAFWALSMRVPVINMH